MFYLSDSILSCHKQNSVPPALPLFGISYCQKKKADSTSHECSALQAPPAEYIKLDKPTVRPPVGFLRSNFEASFSSTVW